MMNNGLHKTHVLIGDNRQELAYNFLIDGIYYNVISLDDMTLEVVKGEKDYNGEINIPATVAYKGKTFTVKAINGFAFEHCSNVTAITIPHTIEELYGYNIFRCRKLKKFVIADGDQPLATSFSLFGSIRAIESLYIGRDAILRNHSNGVALSPFNNLASVKEIIIGNHVTHLHDNLFNSCSGVTAIDIPDSVTSIGNTTFRNCSLKTICMGKNVRTIGCNAFDCNEVNEIYIFCATPPLIDPSSFNNNTYIHAHLRVPKGTLEAYKRANGWDKFWEIKEFSEETVQSSNDSSAGLFTSLSQRLLQVLRYKS